MAPRRVRRPEELMHHEKLHLWEHAHTFAQDRKTAGERRAVLVMGLTGGMMVVEIAAGLAFGSMALLADGLHMASHAAALAINVFAYVYARRHAHDERYSFGTGKVNALGGFTGAVLLAMFALLMLWESGERLIAPVPIAFNQAIVVAVVGLLVNGVSVLILDVGHDHAHEHHGHEEHAPHGHGHAHQHDHNLRSAYLHVLADALTSVLAIVALVSAKYAGLVWMDPFMGVVGAVLVARWSLGLARASSVVLLDRQGPRDMRAAIVHAIEHGSDARVADLHVWAISPNHYALILSLVADAPRPPDYYKALIADADPRLAHLTVEVHPCRDPSRAAAPVA